MANITGQDLCSDTNGIFKRFFLRLVRSERCFGKRSRAFSLGAEVDGTRCEARYRDGVFELVLSKRTGAIARPIIVI
jgi:HSP20 family molecular chaperone IbpA